jgi:hypothetical protein
MRRPREQELNLLRKRREKLLSELRLASHPQVQAMIERELARINDAIARLVR